MKEELSANQLPLQSVEELAKELRACDVLDEYLKDMGDLDDHKYHWVKLAMEDYGRRLLEFAAATKAPQPIAQTEGKQSVEELQALLNKHFYEHGFEDAEREITSKPYRAVLSAMKELSSTQPIAQSVEADKTAEQILEKHLPHYKTWMYPAAIPSIIEAMEAYKAQTK